MTITLRLAEACERQAKEADDKATQLAIGTRGAPWPRDDAFDAARLEHVAQHQKDAIDLRALAAALRGATRVPILEMPGDTIYALKLEEA